MKRAHYLYSYFLIHISFFAQLMYESFQIPQKYQRNKPIVFIPLVSANFCISARVFSSFLGQADTHKAIDLIF